MTSILYWRVKSFVVLKELNGMKTLSFYKTTSYPFKRKHIVITKSLNKIIIYRRSSTLKALNQYNQFFKATYIRITLSLLHLFKAKILVKFVNILKVWHIFYSSSIPRVSGRNSFFFRRYRISNRWEVRTAE